MDPVTLFLPHYETMDTLTANRFGPLTDDRMQHRPQMNSIA